MLVETSTIVAIGFEEDGAAELMARIRDAERPFTTVVNRVEAALAIGRELVDRETAAMVWRCSTGAKTSRGATSSPRRRAGAKVSCLVKYFNAFGSRGKI